MEIKYSGLACTLSFVTSAERDRSQKKVHDCQLLVVTLNARFIKRF